MRPHLLLSPKRLGLILLVALIARFLCSATEIKVWPDSSAYLISAEALLSGTFSDIYPERTPGYILFLASQILFLRATDLWMPETLTHLTVVLQSLFGCMTTLLSAEIAFRLFHHKNIAVLTGLLVALSPNLIQHEHFILTESLYTLLLCLYGYTWLRVHPHYQDKHMVFLGILVALLVWIKPVALVIPGMTCLMLWKQMLPKMSSTLILYCLPVIIALTAWINIQGMAHGHWSYAAGGSLNQLYKVVDFIRPEAATTSPFAQLLLERRAIQPPDKTYNAVNDVVVLQTMQNHQPYWQIYLKADEAARPLVWEAISTQPIRYLMVTFQAFIQLLLTPTDWDPRTLYWNPILLLSLVGAGLCLRGSDGFKNPQLWILALAWGQLCLYPWLTVADPRYRIPMEPLLIPFAMYGLFQLLTFQAHKRSIPPEGEATG